MSAGMRKRIFGAEDKLIAKVDNEKQIKRQPVAAKRQRTAVSFVGEKTALVWHL